MKPDVGGHLSHALDEVVHRGRLARDCLVALVVGIGEHVLGLIGALLPRHAAKRGLAVGAGLRLGVSGRDAAVGGMERALIKGEAAGVALPLAGHVLLCPQSAQLGQGVTRLQNDFIEVPFCLRQGRSPS